MILGRSSVRSGAYSIMQAWCFTTLAISSRGQHMASPRFKSSYWLLSAAGLFAALVGVSPASFAQVTSDDTAIMNTIDRAIRTAEYAGAAIVLSKFAESRNSEAQYRLGSLYRIGRGVPQDDLLAFKWMKAAAEQNHANAQFNLAKTSWIQKADRIATDVVVGIGATVQPDRIALTIPAGSRVVIPEVVLI